MLGCPLRAPTAQSGRQASFSPLCGSVGGGSRPRGYSGRKTWAVVSCVFPSGAQRGSDTCLWQSGSRAHELPAVTIPTWTSRPASAEQRRNRHVEELDTRRLRVFRPAGGHGPRGRAGEAHNPGSQEGHAPPATPGRPQWFAWIAILATPPAADTAAAKTGACLRATTRYIIYARGSRLSSALRPARASVRLHDTSARILSSSLRVSRFFSLSSSTSRSTAARWSARSLRARSSCSLTIRSAPRITSAASGPASNR